MADDKGQTMTIKVDETALLDVLGEHGEHWVKGEWGDGDSMCLHGAIRRCAPQPGDAFLIEQVAARQGWGVRWNDDTATSWEMVRARLAHVEVSDDDLAVTFGPQWEPLVALVRRAAVLTMHERLNMSATARGAVRVFARVAAIAAARVAAWDAARDAAWDAAGIAVPKAAGVAVRDAAGALVVRDLIGQHGFTQEHYDTLTGPWRSVIGSVHPDDVQEARRG